MKRLCAVAVSPANRCCRFWRRALDNVVFHLGFANTRAAARQMVCHGHITVKGRKVNIPSYALKVNDVIEVKNHSVSRQLATKNLEVATSRAVPDWLSLSKEEFKGTAHAHPDARRDPADRQ
jgi:small subunit ribosomal protein S4